MKVLCVAITCVALTFSSLLFLAEVYQELNGIHEQKELTKFWKRYTAIEELKLALLRAQFEDFKQEVSTLFPNEKLHVPSSENQKQLRNLSSVIPRVKAQMPIGVRAVDLLEKGKTQVVENQYAQGISTLEALLKDFPDSHHGVEARYLIMESHFQLKKFEKAVEMIDRMIEIFPENPMTGYALIKLGGLYEQQNRLEDALEVYRTVLSAFQGDENLTELANKNVKLLEL